MVVGVERLGEGLVGRPRRRGPRHRPAAVRPLAGVRQHRVGGVAEAARTRRPPRCGPGPHRPGGPDVDHADEVQAPTWVGDVRCCWATQLTPCCRTPARERTARSSMRRSSPSRSPGTSPSPRRSPPTTSAAARPRTVPPPMRGVWQRSPTSGRPWPEPSEARSCGRPATSRRSAKHGASTRRTRPTSATAARHSSPPARPKGGRRMDARRSIRSLAVARFASTAGSQAAQIALAFRVYEETGSAAWVSAALVASVGVVGLVGPVSGRLADRVDRQRLMVVTELAGAVGWVLVLAAPSPAALVIAVLVATAANAPFRAASAAAIASIAGPDDLSWANGTLATAGNAALVLGPLAGGALVGTVGARCGVRVERRDVRRLRRRHRPPAKRGSPMRRSPTTPQATSGLPHHLARSPGRPSASTPVPRDRPHLRRLRHHPRVGPPPRRPLRWRLTGLCAADHLVGHRSRPRLGPRITHPRSREADDGAGHRRHGPVPRIPSRWRRAWSWRSPSARSAGWAEALPSRRGSRCSSVRGRCSARHGVRHRRHVPASSLHHRHGGSRLLPSPCWDHGLYLLPGTLLLVAARAATDSDPSCQRRIGVHGASAAVAS